MIGNKEEMTLVVKRSMKRRSKETMDFDEKKEGEGERETERKRV